MLDFVDDDILDHTSLDACVYEQSDDPDRNKVPPITFILQAVVLSAPDKLDQKFANLKNARDIVGKYSSDPNGDENSNLTKLLNWCWRQGTFEKIRRLSEHSFIMGLVLLSYGLTTAEILRPMSAHQGQALWEERERYA